MITAYAAVGMISNRTALRVLLDHLTLNSATAFHRIVIWEKGVNSIASHPLFGIGFHDWDHPTWMSNSMDAFWLVVFVMYGLPAGIALVCGAISIANGVSRSFSGVALDDRMRRAWLTSFVGLCIAGATVHFWNQSFVWFSFFLGTGVALISPKKRRRLPLRLQPLRDSRVGG